MMKKLDMKIEESPFYNFQNARTHITFKINAQKTYNYCKKNNLSFFTVSLGLLLKGLNDIPELRRKIINNQAVEFDKIDGITPLLDENKNMLEMKITPIKENETLKEWHDKVQKEKNAIIKGEKPSYNLKMDERDKKPIANFSCIPWINFDSMVTCVTEPHQTQPLITWGKLENGKMSVAITTSHIFVFGYHLGLFNKSIQEYFNNPEKL
jgi:chloramphenicol O-acetyltransferase type A